MARRCQDAVDAAILGGFVGGNVPATVEDALSSTSHPNPDPRHIWNVASGTANAVRELARLLDERDVSPN